MSNIIPPNEAAATLERYRRDLDYACPVVHCQARRGEACRDVPPPLVHQSRRVRRLQNEQAS